MLSRVDPTIPTPQVGFFLWFFGFITAADTDLQAICIAPSRELARQIQEVVDQMGQFTQVGTFLAIPGSWSRNARIDKQILIGTPGTLVDMLMRGSRILDPRMVRVLVLDEADELIAQQGLGEQTFRIKQCVLFLYSSVPYADGQLGSFPPTSKMFFSLLLSMMTYKSSPTDSPPKPTRFS